MDITPWIFPSIPHSNITASHCLCISVHEGTVPPPNLDLGSLACFSPFTEFPQCPRESGLQQTQCFPFLKIPVSLAVHACVRHSSTSRLFNIMLTQSLNIARYSMLISCHFKNKHTESVRSSWYVDWLMLYLSSFHTRYQLATISRLEYDNRTFSFSERLLRNLSWRRCMFLTLSNETDMKIVVYNSFLHWNDDR